jgi:acyl-CoA thioesterase II
MISNFRGSNLWKPLGGRAVFGGQVIGQALQAATLTISDDLHVHSMHCYFIRPGKIKQCQIRHANILHTGSSQLLLKQTGIQQIDS